MTTIPWSDEMLETSHSDNLSEKNILLEHNRMVIDKLIEAYKETHTAPPPIKNFWDPIVAIILGEKPSESIQGLSREGKIALLSLEEAYQKKPELTSLLKQLVFEKLTAQQYHDIRKQYPNIRNTQLGFLVSINTINLSEFIGNILQGSQGQQVFSLAKQDCYLLPPLYWKALGAALKTSGVQSLDLSWNSLCLLTPEQWIALGSALKKSGIQSLHLGHNKLYQLTPEQWVALGSALKESGIQSLSLHSDKLYRLTPEQWVALGSALKESGIQSLALSMNELYRLTPEQWVALGSALKESGIQSLNLNGNSLYQLTPKEWKIFVTALKISGITALTVSDNDLSTRRQADLNTMIDKNARVYCLKKNEGGLQQLIRYTLFNTPGNTFATVRQEQGYRKKLNADVIKTNDEFEASGFGRVGY